MKQHSFRWILVGFLLSTPAGVSAQTTGFKTSERTTGMTKQCFYDVLGSSHTLTVSSVDLCPLTIKVQTQSARPAAVFDSSASSPRTQRTIHPAPAPPPAPSTITAFKTGERTTGMTKQCFYNGLGSTYTETVRSVDLCPLSIKVRSGRP
jgi:hypothetical protein